MCYKRARTRISTLRRPAWMCVSVLCRPALEHYGRENAFSSPATPNSCSSSLYHDVFVRLLSFSLVSPFTVAFHMVNHDSRWGPSFLAGTKTWWWFGIIYIYILLYSWAESQTGSRACRADLSVSDIWWRHIVSCDITVPGAVGMV